MGHLAIGDLEGVVELWREVDFDVDLGDDLVVLFGFGVVHEGDVFVQELVEQGEDVLAEDRVAL